MASFKETRFYRNFTTSCTIGIDPVKLAEMYRGKVLPPFPKEGEPWTHPTLYKGGEQWFMPPGGVWADGDGYFRTMREGVYSGQMFIHCENEDELVQLQGMHPELVPVREKETGKLKGFYGAHYVLEDITKDHEEILKNVMSGRAHGDTLRREAEEGAKAKTELEKLKAEHDAVKREHARLRDEVAALKSKTDAKTDAKKGTQANA